MKQSAIDTRRRLATDFEFYAKHCVKIRTKTGDITPLLLNAAQKRLLAVIDDQLRTTGKVRVVILKARQMGFSTFVSAYIYWRLSHEKAKKGIVVAHKADSTRSLFDAYQRIHSEMPAPVKPSTKYSSRRELVFDKLDTALIVATAGGDGLARGETITTCHCSETAFWAPSVAADNWNALGQAIPNTPGTIVFSESTANGMTGVFYDLWQGAVNGTNGYYPFFAPWFEDPTYREPISQWFNRTIEEDELCKKYGLDDEQLQFRRTKIALNGRDKFEQEYPANAEEAFKASGRPVFVPEMVIEMINKAPKQPIERMALEGGKWEPHSCGELHVYRDYDPGEVYTIGVDVALGIRNGDYSVAQVLDSNKRQVAVWKGHVEPYHFATVLNHLGLYYNRALLAVEHNQHGLATLTQLFNVLMYPNLYMDVIEGKTTEDYTERLGFFTSVKSKTLIIDRLRAAIRDREIEINDLGTLREMQTFVATESGSLEADKGCHDDCVMSLAIANHVHVRRAPPIEITDEWYSYIP